MQGLFILNVQVQC